MHMQGMVGVMARTTLAIIIKWESQIKKREKRIIDIIIDDDLKSLSTDIILRICFGSSYLQGKLIFTKLKAIQMAVSTPGLHFGFHS